MAQRKFKIITDSSADMPEEYYVSHDVEALSLGFFLNGETYLGEDGKPMDVREFYRLLRGGAMPTTYQVPGEVSKLHAEKYLKEGRDVLIIAFSSGLSGTASGMKVAARDLSEKYPERKIFVVDSLAASMGEGLLLDYVIRKADSGASIEETYSYAEEVKNHICHFFTVDDLFHLKRGGRVSAATAIVGSILNIKPLLHVDEEGHLISIGKAMGRKKSIRALADYMSRVQEIEDGAPVFISHGDCLEDAEFLKSIVLERFADKHITVSINDVGPVIGTHSGPGTLALFFYGKNKKNPDLKQ